MQWSERGKQATSNTLQFKESRRAANNTSPFNFQPRTAIQLEVSVKKIDAKLSTNWGKYEKYFTTQSYSMTVNGDLICYYFDKN